MSHTKPPSPLRRGEEERRTIARGELLAWVERALGDNRVRMPDALRADGEALVRAWKFSRPREPQT